MADATVGILRVLLTANTAEYDAAMKKAGDSVKKFESEFAALRNRLAGNGGTTGAVTGLNGALGGLSPLLSQAVAGFTAWKAIGFAKTLIDEASAVNDLSERIGVSIEAVQRWKFAADQTGASIDDVAMAMDHIGKAAVEQTPQAVEAFGRLGFTIDQILAMNPEDRMNAVAEAIGKLPDPAQRSATAMELLGRSGTRLLPAMVEGFTELGDKAQSTGNVIAGNTVKATEALGDSFSTLLGTGKGLIFSFFAPFLPAITAVVGAITTAVGWIATLTAKIVSLDAVMQSDALAHFGYLLEEIGLKAEAALPKLAALEAEGAKNMAKLAASAKIPDDALKNLDATYAELDSRQKAFNSARDAQIAKAKEAAQAEEDLKLKVIELTAALKDQYDQQQLAIAQWGEFDQALQMLPITDVIGKMQDYDVAAEQATTKNDLLTQAFKTLGITSRAELQKIAEQARLAYLTISEQLGKTSPEAIEAFKKWQEAAKNAAGETKKSWSDVFPHITNIVTNIQKAVEGSFAQMILGAKGFHDGFLDIWKSLKAGIAQILTEILGDFVNRFLKGLLNALLGAQGGFGAAFKGLLGGGLGSLFGGGTAFAGVPGTMVPGGAAGTWAGTGGAGIPFWQTGIGGGLIGGAAGGLVGGIVGNKTGSGLGGGLAGAGTGFGAGFGFGGPIGGLIGAGIGGLIGWYTAKRAQMGANDARDVFQSQFGGQGTGAGSGFMNLAAKLTSATGEAGGGALFKQLQDAHTPEKVAQAIEAINKALAEYEARSKSATGAEQANTEALKQNSEEQKRHAEVIKTQIADIDQQIEAINASEAPEEHMGAIEKAQREALAKQKANLEKSLDDVQKSADDTLDTIGDSSDDNVLQITDGWKLGFAKILQDADIFAAGIEQKLKAIDVPTLHIPVVVDSATGMPSGTEIPGHDKGGVFDREHIARIAEGGKPEIVGDVDFIAEAMRKAGIGGGGTANVNLYIDRNLVASQVVEIIPDHVASNGRALGKWGRMTRSLAK